MNVNVTNNPRFPENSKDLLEHFEETFKRRKADCNAMEAARAFLNEAGVFYGWGVDSAFWAVSFDPVARAMTIIPEALYDVRGQVVLVHYEAETYVEARLGELKVRADNVLEAIVGLARVYAAKQGYT